MIVGRSFWCLVTGGLLLFAQLHIPSIAGCPMCGASCRCTSHGQGASCLLRSVGCGGEDTGSTVGSASPLRAVLAAHVVVSPSPEFDGVIAIPSHRPAQPARPPLDRPPRLSC
jgi:hypothetical protein